MSVGKVVIMTGATGVIGGYEKFVDPGPGS